MPDHMQGMGIIKVLVLIPIMLILLLALVFAFYEARKIYWDYQVREMCEADGGITVNETVSITRAQLRTWGGVNDLLPIPHETDMRIDVPYFRRTKDKVLHSWNPQVMRLETIFIRREDQKVLGKSVHYYRRGGDFPSPAHESVFGCTKPETPIEKSIILVKEESK